MNSFILHLLESSLVLTVLYSLYVILLKNVTFFNFNRYFLIAILAFSIISPTLKVDLFSWKSGLINEPIEDLSKMRLSYYDAFESGFYESGTDVHDFAKSATDSYWVRNKDFLVKSILTIYCIGLIAMLFRFLWILLRIRNLKSSNPKTNIQGVNVVRMPNKVAPFSFMNYAFVQEATINSKEINQILAHERIHIEQRHSYDLLFAQILAAFLWFNPVVWILIKSLKTTHEYIADHEIINKGYSIVEYKTLLLKQLISNHTYGLLHHFNLSFIKKRINMMELKESGWTGKLKVAFTLFSVAVLSLFIVGCNSIIDDRQTTSIITTENVNPISQPIKSSSIFPEQETNVPGRKPLDEKDIKELSSAFGMRMHPVEKVEKMHLGVDFLAKMNTPVYATADGNIVQIQTSDPGEGYGNLVTIKHSKGYSTKYAHLSGFNNIEVGQEVKKGDIIGFVGSSGQSFGPHLHYEVLVNDRRVDPADYFE